MKNTAINDAAATSEEVRESSRELTHDELVCVSGGSLNSNILNIKHQTAQSIISNMRS
jgi:hypothetical protein